MIYLCFKKKEAWFVIFFFHFFLLNILTWLTVRMSGGLEDSAKKEPKKFPSARPASLCFLFRQELSGNFYIFLDYRIDNLI